MTAFKKYLSLTLALLLIMGLTGCTSCSSCQGKTDKPGAAGVTEVAETVADSTEKEIKETAAPTETTAEVEPEEAPAEEEEPAEEAKEPAASDDPLTLTDEERAKGTQLFFPLGAKYTLTQGYKDQANFIKRQHRGHALDFMPYLKYSREQFFRPDGWDGVNAKRYPDSNMWEKFPLFGAFVLHKADADKMDLAEIQHELGFPNLEKVREDDDYVQYFAFGDYDQAPVDELDPAEQEIYKQLLDEVPEIRKGFYAFRPMDLEESIGGVKNWKFKSQLLDGTPVDESIFKDKDVTLVSFMTTWCPHCIDELPQFQKATTDFLKDKNGQIIALYADVVPEDEAINPEAYAEVKATAAELLTDAGATFPAMQNSYDVQNTLTKYAMNYPTNFFVDRDGNVLNVEVGEYEDLAAAFDEALALAKGETTATEVEDAEAQETEATEEEDTYVFENYKNWPVDKKLTDQKIAEVLADPELTLTQEERNENYDLYAVVGGKFKLPEAFADDFAPYRRRHQGFDSKPGDLIRMSREYYYYAQDDGNEDAYLDYPLFGLFVLNKEQVPEDEEALKEALGFQILKKTYEDADTVQYFAKGLYNKDISEKDKNDYDALFNEVPEIEASLYAFPALDLNNTIGRTKNWKFETANHEGNTVNEAIFENADITLVSYMTTWCPHCANELPVLEKVAKEKGEKFQVIYIVADANGDFGDPENLKKAQAALDELFKDYDNVNARVLYNSISIDNSLGKFAMNFPTNFFVDRLGNVVGDIYLGGFDEASLLEELQIRFKLTHAK